MRNRVNDFLRKLKGDELDVKSKIFILLTLLGVVSMLIMAIIDLVIAESPVAVIALLGMSLFGPIVTNISIRANRAQIGAIIISTAIIFIITPVAFFLGGGTGGGGVIWFCYAYLYIGLTLVGTARIVMMIILSAVVLSEFMIAYINPLLIVPYERSASFLHIFVSVLLVGLTSFIMLQFQYRLYLDQYMKAKDQAEKIEKMNKAQNRFFSSMSHEIRTPINTIIGLNEMTLRENVSAEVNENSRNIQSASNILLSLINDILDMSKIESGKMDIIKAQYDVGKMLTDIVNMIWVKAQEKGLKFSVSVDPSMPSQLFCDEVRLKQILINLLNNAVKYTSEGSVTLSVHCIRTGAGMAHVTYSVEDTGIGIRKENIPFLFDAFRREDERRNRFIEGTGLGLSIVKQLVELLGGTVSVNSVYTKGSTFVVEIDQEIANEQEIGDFASRHMHSAREEYAYHQSFEAPEARILVVDDNTANLLVVEKLLKNTRVQITTADSGARCLELTLTQPFDLILMDHLMPSMDGIECLHALREQVGGLCKETPVVALTANAGSENQALYRREGFDEYIVKPVDFAELEHTVQKLLPLDLVHTRSGRMERYASDKIVREMRKKVPILVTTESMADIPPELLKKLNIPIISCRVRLESGVFYDSIEAGSEGITRYMEDITVVAKSEAPSVAEHEAFFSEQLTRAQHIIHISSARYASLGFERASEAALSFYNVHVVDSTFLSSGTGLLALYAFDLAESGKYDPEELIMALAERKRKIEFSFIIRTTDYLYRSGRLSAKLNTVCNTLLLHPILDSRDSRISAGGMIVGRYERVAKKYVRRCLRNPESIDTSVLFITYVVMRYEEVEQVKEMVSQIVRFDRIYCTKAVPSIAVNCGPGTFGLIFSRKKND